jgi:6-phosphogluconolactonase (cycloisomerase 2 family)
MRATTRLHAAAIAAVASLAVAAGSTPAFAAGASRAVFVQTDNIAGNQIVVYSRAADGTLNQTGVYATGGLGGALPGSVVDHLASQGSLAYDRDNALLYAVNAASNTVSVFAVLGDRLALRQTIDSGGKFPASISFHRGLVYVLNAKDGGYLQGFAVHAGHLVAIPGSGRALGLGTFEEPQFVHTPGQVLFSPDGSQLLVTTKASGSAVDVFSVAPNSGLLSDTPVVNPEPGAVPFAGVFDRQGHFVVTEAGTNALASFTLGAGGTLAPLDAVGTGQAATCWVVAAPDGRFYVSNAGSASLSTVQSGAGGQLTLLGNTPTDGGTVDAALAEGGRFLYVQTGAAGILDEFAVGAQGTLTEIGSVTVPGAVGGEGIAVG